jgi:hypothetical protein
LPDVTARICRERENFQGNLKNIDSIRAFYAPRVYVRARARTQPL